MRTKMLFLGFVSSIVAIPFFGSACGSSETCADQVGGCFGSDDGGGSEMDVDVSSEDGGRRDVEQPPLGCDEKAEPKDAPACVVSEYGVFVDGTHGDDGNPGTKSSPVKTIMGALGKLGSKPRVYVCEGTYAEHVKVTQATSLYGGFACGSWSYTGVKVKVTPIDVGYALEVSNVAAPMVVADVRFQSQDATQAGESSLAVFLTKAADVTLRRTEVVAGKAMGGTDASASASNLYSVKPSDLDGNPATGASGGPSKTCSCKVYGSSVGGKGGNAGPSPAPNGDPGAATPMPTATPPRTSAGGDGYTTAIGFCTPGRAGADGMARSAGPGASTYGVLRATGWEPASGADGEAGNPGGGGGGGGGGDSDGSGGGGCGGCGGNGGLGGRGGGSSMAVAAFESGVHLVASALTSNEAGKGGNGSVGGGGGGGGGGATTGACGGGKGGNGAGGSGGGGGAGGLSIGVLRFGGVLSKDDMTTVSVGAAGSPGTGAEGGMGGSNPLGTAPSGATATAGKTGVSQAIVELTP